MINHSRPDFNRDWGVVTFNLVGDTLNVLRAGSGLALQEHRAITHYSVRRQGDEIALILYWSKASDSIELPFKLDTPEELTRFVESWLFKAGEWPSETPDTDGDFRLGFTITNDVDPTAWTVDVWYVAMMVVPTYIIYGK